MESHLLVIISIEMLLLSADDNSYTRNGRGEGEILLFSTTFFFALYSHHLAAHRSLHRLVALQHRAASLS